MGGHGLPAAGVVLDQDALFVAAVHVAGYQVELLAAVRLQEGEVADAGDLAVPAYGVGGPETGDLRKSVFRVEEALDAVEFDQDGASLRGGREAEAEEEVPVFAEGGAFDVDRVVILAHEAGPLLACFSPRSMVASISALCDCSPSGIRSRPLSSARR